MSSGQYSFIDLGLPELPLNTDPKIEPDLRYISFAIRNLAMVVGQKAGFDEPYQGYQNSAGAAYTISGVRSRLYLPATEAITYGQVVNTFDNAGTYSVRLADATAGYLCHGICNTPGTTAPGGTIEIALPNCYVGSVSGLTPGVIYYLATTAGSIQNAPPAGSGELVQTIGFAVGATGLFFQASLMHFVVP